MDDAVEVRDFQEGDQERACRLILDGLGDHWGAVDESLNPDLNDLAVSYAQGRMIVADLGGELIGIGILMPVEPAVSEILRMSVDSSFRRQGVGRALVGELIETARRLSVRRVVLETSSSWSEVIAFYVSCGFEITGTRDGEFGEDTWFERCL